MTITTSMQGLACAFAALSLSSFVTAAPHQSSKDSSLTFAKCDDALGLTSDFQCGTLKVPIDHDHPSEGTIDLFVSRRKANGTSIHLGNLVYNNGGPGAAGLELFQELALGLPAFSQEILESYDLISIDPRGIGLSNPISCDKDLWNKQPKYFATDDDSFDKLVASNKAIGESCLKLTGPLAKFMDSVSNVKDYELVRKALGGGKFNYIGYSYGTLWGQIYAELYPKNVGRMVLDSAVDHSVPEDIYYVMTETQTYQATLEQFFSWCKENDKECSLSGEKDLPGLFQNLTVLDKTIPASQCKDDCRSTVTGEDILFQVEEALAFVESSILGNWSALSDALYAAKNGDASAFSRKLYQDNTDRTSDSLFANRLTSCQDWGSQIKTAADLKRIVDVASHLAPLTRGASESFDARVHCVGWPAPLSNPPREWNAKTMKMLPPILIVSSFYDPETSAVWAESVRNQLPTSVGVWRNGAGHTSYLLYGETNKAMDDFLLNGTVPKDGTVYES